MAKISQPSGWVGWVYFAGILMLVRGAFQIFEGILGIINNSVYFVRTPNTLTTFSLETWGWVHIGVGILLLTGAVSVFAGRAWGRVIGSLMVGLSLLVNLMFLPAYPIWSILLVVLDVVMLYALIVRGAEAAE